MAVDRLPPTTAVLAEARKIARIEGAGRCSATPVSLLVHDYFLHTTKDERRGSGVAGTGADTSIETGRAEEKRN